MNMRQIVLDTETTGLAYSTGLTLVGLKFAIAARVLEENDDAKIAAALERGRVIAQRIQSQGWGTGDVDYALAALAAAGGAVPDALGHLNDAIDRGWRSFLLANQDPAMASLHATAEYQAMIQQVQEM